MKLLGASAAVVASFTVASATTGTLMEEKVHDWDLAREAGVLGKRFDSIRNEPAYCDDATKTTVIRGEAFNCSEVDFYSFISLDEMEITSQPHQPIPLPGATALQGADMWGWLSPTGKEITLMCMDNGMAVIDTTNPVDPCIIGKLPSNRRPDVWCDVKVYKDTAYIVKDSRGGDYANDTTAGGQVLDLLPLDDVVCSALSEPLELEANYVWPYHGSSHNLIVNTETGFLYSVGTDYCSGGMIVMDLKRDRLHPDYVACIDGDGYTHDAQCLIYAGPDTRFTGQEICFAFNEDTLTVWDVTDKFSPEMLSRVEYPSQVYAHQGWLNDDSTLIIMNDELNERCGAIPEENRTGSCATRPLGPLNGITKTSTIVFDVGRFGSLTNPIFTGTYLHEDDVIDHNLYMWGTMHRRGDGGNPPMENHPSVDYAYCNNYLAGLRILDISSGEVERFKEVGYFDIAPDLTGLNYLGAWTGYLHPSGVYTVSSIERGMFILQPRMVFQDSNAPPVEEPTDGDDFELTTVLLAVIAVLVAAIAFMLAFYVFKGKFSGKSKASVEEFDVEKKAELKGAPIVHYT